MSWDGYVKAAQKMGFEKVTIISRSSFAPVAYSSAYHIPQAYTREETMINENQELLDWGMDKGKPKSSFWFYQTKFAILLRDTDDESMDALACLKGSEVLVGCQFKSIWFLAYANLKSEEGKKLGTARTAYNQITRDMWYEMAENGV